MAFVLFYRALRKTSVILTTLTCLLLGNSKLQAQLIANFNPDKTGGCSPLTVSFTNTTTGASASATYSWNFGNGNTITTSDAVTPVAATYFAAQTYTVTLTVHDGGRTASKSVVLNVYKSPGVDFTVSNPTGCLPLTTSFSSVSVPGDGFITNYFWDFGDGNTLSTSSPTVSNTYNFAGGHSVSLTVTNSFGCTNTRKKDNLVMVFPAVTAAFTADSTTLCSLSDPVQFKNLSSGSGVLTYSWNFGDGANSTSQNPSHQYALKGTYTVQLTVTSAQGCSSTLAKKTYINAANLNPDFSSASPLCTGNSIIFTDKSNPAPTGNPLWDFGDGASGIGSSVSHQFPASGNYLVTITNKFGNCVVSQSKNITISNSPVTGGFLINKGILCQSPMLVNFDDTTQSSAKWLWNFTGNPGDTSSVRNPSFLYTTNGIYKPTLTVTDTNGCSTTVSETLNSAQPTATIRMDTTLTPSNTICATVDAKFTAISQDIRRWYNLHQSHSDAYFFDPWYLYNQPFFCDQPRLYRKRLPSRYSQGISKTACGFFCTRFFTMQGEPIRGVYKPIRSRRAVFLDLGGW
jgi:PKD repeat protein